jgi:hypothetical protein
MRPNVRTLLWLSPLALAAGALCLVAGVQPGGAGHQGLTETWPLLALDRSLDEEVRKTSQCLQAKRQVARALIEGRLTPQEAVARFRDITAGLPDKVRGWRPPEYTEEEWANRQVIGYVELELTANRRTPAQAEEWVCRLEAEFREHLRSDRFPRSCP